MSGLLLVLGTSCDGGEPTPTTLPTQPSAASSTPGTGSPTSSPTPTVSPTPAAPTLPAAARADTPAGAESFARFWLQTLDYATRTGDTQLLRKLADCPGCNSIADGIDQLSQQGGRATGGAVTVTTAKIVRHVAGKAALVDVTYDRAARTVEKAGKSQAVPAEKGVRLLITLRRDGDWLITNAQPAE